MEGSGNEDPLKEIAALQYLKVNGPHPHIIEVTEVSGQCIDAGSPQLFRFLVPAHATEYAECNKYTRRTERRP